jgi:hypothetical protein
MEFFKIPLKEFIKNIRSTSGDSGELVIESFNVDFNQQLKFLEYPSSQIKSINTIQFITSLENSNGVVINKKNIVLDVSFLWDDDTDEETLELAKIQLSKFMGVDESCFKKCTHFDIYYNEEHYMQLEQTGESDSFIYIFS